LIYQGVSLFVEEEPEMGHLAPSVGITAEKDNYVAASTRVDLVVKQKIRDHFELFLYVNNITNVKENTFLAGSVKNLVTSSIMYGTTADIGVTYKF
jgi:outer membrane receptor protein involved in Fe transport